jgi:hypothetical protein
MRDLPRHLRSGMPHRHCPDIVEEHAQPPQK